MNSLKKYMLLFLSFFFYISIQAQDSSYKDSIMAYHEEIMNSITDEARIKAGKSLEAFLTDFFVEGKSEILIKDTIKVLSVVTDKESNTSLITWFVPLTNGTFKYHGLLLFSSKKKPKVKQHESHPYFFVCQAKNQYLIKLTDRSGEITQPETRKLDQTNWYGACYYKIIPRKIKKKTTYTLLGWKGNNHLTQKKVIDMMSISENGRVEFAGNFSNNKKTLKRLVFEYSNKVVMTLKYDEKEEFIIMDHLAAPPRQSSDDPDLTGQFFTYGPDFSYDALDWNKGSWILKEKYDARNPKDKDREKKLKPKKGKSESIYKTN